MTKSKAATLEKHRFLCLVVALALVAATVMSLVVPRVVRADDYGQVTGRFGVNSENVTVNSVELYNSSDNATVDSMDPTSTYVARVSVTHNNTLNFLDKIQVMVYYDEDGIFSSDNVPLSGDPQNGVIMTWDGIDNWTINRGDSNTWRIVTDNCVDPDDLGAQNTFIFKFKFTVGTVAKESAGAAEWHIYAQARDTGGGMSSAHQENLEMNWYGAITVELSEGSHLEFGNLNLGTADRASTNTVNAIYVSNGNYERNIRTLGTWSGNTYSIRLDTDYDGSPENGEFALRADDDSSIGGAIIVRTTYVAMSETLGITDEGGDEIPGMTVWITLASTGINADIYTGTIYYQISNG